MLPGVGWTELLLIAALAIIVVGPRELPFLMRKVGRFLGQARAMAREFQDSFEDIAREAELEELRKRTRETVKDVERAANPLSPEAEEDFVKAHNESILNQESAAIGASDAEPLAAGGAQSDKPDITPKQTGSA